MRALLLSLAVVAAALLVHGGALWNGFVDYDDRFFVMLNPTVMAGLTPEGIGVVFTSSHHGQWQPVSWMSHMLDVDLFGLEPAGHHATSIVLHCLNALLLFHVLRRMTGRLGPSVFVALLFAVHPIHVEPVAWVSSRKDVLSTFFGLLVLWSYGGVEGRLWKEPGRAIAVAVFFALGLLAKPMLVTLPCLMLLLDVWPLGRLRGGPASVRTERAGRERLSPAALVLEKLPLFALAVIPAVVVSGVVAADQGISFGARAANAFVAVARYLRNLAWPTDLAAFYPHPELTVQGGWSALAVTAAVLLVAVISALVLLGRRRAPGVAVGWLWFLGTLVPVLGLRPIASHAMADRYAYVPAIGIYIAFAWGLEAFARERPRFLPALRAAGLLAILALGVLATRQVRVWRDIESLWRHAVAVTSYNYVAHANLGRELLNQGRLDEAETELRGSIASRTDDPEAWGNLGLVYRGRGDMEGALECFLEAAEIDPDDGVLQANIGGVLLQLNRLDEAEGHLRRAVETAPEMALPHNNLGILLERQGDRLGALASFERAVRADGDSPEANANLGRALAQDGKIGRARDHLRHALRLRPGNVDARVNLALILEGEGRPADAAVNYQAALQVDPSLAAVRSLLAHLYLKNGRIEDAARELAVLARDGVASVEELNDLGITCQELGRLDEAIQGFEAALELEPQSAETHNNLAGALWTAGRLDEAAVHYERALAITPDLARTLSNYGMLLQSLGRLDEALERHTGALRLDPSLWASADNLAWIRATSPEARHRDAAEAVLWAEACAEASGHQAVSYLVTLAAAYAEAGRFEDAVRWQEAVVAAAPAVERAAMQERLELYRSGQPFRETTR